MPSRHVEVHGGPASIFRGTVLSQPLRKELSAIEERWRDLCRDGRLPSRADFPVESLTPWLGHIQIVELVGNGGACRYRVRLSGTRIVYYEGHDNTGKFLDEVIPADMHDEVLEPYRRCMDSRNAVYGTFYSCSDAAIS